MILDQPTLRTNVRFANISYEGQSFRSPLYYGAHIGYFLSRKLGIEAEFTHLKVFAKVNQQSNVRGVLNGALVNSTEPLDSVVQHFAISHGVNLLLANAVFRQPIWRASGPSFPRGFVSVSFGAGATFPHGESVIQGHGDEHYQVGSPAIQIAAGLEVRLWHRVYWSGEYKFTRTHEQVDVFQGKATTLLRSHHVVTGPAIHF